MNKFEEEFNYLIELSGKVLTGQIEAEKFEKHRAIFLNKYGKKHQPEIPEVPQLVADWIKKLKLEKREPLENPITFGETLPGLTDKDLEKAFNWIRANQETYMVAWINGYTVAKEKRFYLKNKLTGGYIEQDCYNGTRETYNLSDRTEFTQQEIDSMDTGSYEQIEVEE